MTFKGQDILLSFFLFLHLLFELITQCSDILLRDLFLVCTRLPLSCWLSLNNLVTTSLAASSGGTLRVPPLSSPDISHCMGPSGCGCTITAETHQHYITYKHISCLTKPLLMLNINMPMTSMPFFIT